jgi:hypothetical protein
VRLAGADSSDDRVRLPFAQKIDRDLPDEADRSAPTAPALAKSKIFALAFAGSSEYPPSLSTESGMRITLVIASEIHRERGAAGTCRRESLLEISLPDDVGVMNGVSGDDVRERSHGEWIVAGNPLTEPRIFGQLSKEIDGGRANVSEFLDVAFPRALIGGSVSRCHLLVVLATAAPGRDHAARRPTDV